MAEYAGARRAGSALSDGFGDDSATAGTSQTPQSCPECGSLVRADQKWCTLCLHVLHEPEPQPELEPEPESQPEPAPAAVPAPPVAAGVPMAATRAVAGEVAAAPGVSPEAGASALSPEAEAVADALMAQLATQTRQESFQVPSFLRSKSQRAVAIVAVTGVLSTVVFVVFDVLGAALH